MIRKPNNWDNVQEMGEREKLPLGAYVCKVKQVRVQDNDYGSQLAVLYDITEGDYKGYYDADFKANQNPDKKWKGLLRVWLPKDDGSDRDETTKRIFKGFVSTFERCNPGYTWDWNENSLVGKTVGILYRNEEWDYNGKHGWAARPFRVISTDAVREGTYTIPKDKPLNNSSASVKPTHANVPAGYTEVEDDDLPF